MNVNVSNAAQNYIAQLDSFERNKLLHTFDGMRSDYSNTIKPDNKKIITTPREPTSYLTRVGDGFYIVYQIDDSGNITILDIVRSDQVMKLRDLRNRLSHK